MPVKPVQNSVKVSEHEWNIVALIRKNHPDIEKIRRKDDYLWSQSAEEYFIDTFSNDKINEMLSSSDFNDTFNDSVITKDDA